MLECWGPLRELSRRRRSSLALAAVSVLVLLVLGAGPGSAHSTQVADGAPVVTRLNLPTNDLLFDPVSNTLYASVPGRAGVLGNRVLALDPATGAVRDSVFVGSEPGRLAVSADGQFLYVALNGAAAVRRVALPSLTPGLQFSLGADSFFGAYLVEDMAVLPDDPHAVAVSRMYVGVSPRHAGVAIYDDGVMRPNATPGHTGSNAIEFGGSSGRLYGYNNETTEYGFRRMAVGPTGVSIVDATPDLISGFGVDMKFDGGRIFTTNGRVIDPESLRLLGLFSNASGPVAPDLVHGNVFYVSSGVLQDFDSATFALHRSFAISGMSGSASSLVGIGRSDVAFRTSGDQVFLVHFQPGPDATPPALSAPADISVDATGPAGAVVNYTTSAVDDVDGAVPVSCTPSSSATFPIGTSIVVCTASDAAGNSSAATFKVTVRAAVPQVSSIGLPANDLVFDPGAGRLYASVPGRAGALGNRVVAIDPATGAVVASAFVGSDPSKLALSADGRFLYVALNGAAAVRRVALPALTPGLQFSLGLAQAEDMQVLPNDPHAVAVSRMLPGFSPHHVGLAIYDDGVKRPSAPANTGSNVIELGSQPGRLYGYTNETSDFSFTRMTVGSTGISTVDTTRNLISGFGVDMKFDGGRIFATNGRVVDPESLTRVATFPGVAGPVEPDVAHGRVFFVSSGTVQEFDSSTYTLRQSVPIGAISGSASSLVTIGGRGDLAFRTSGDQIFFVHFRTGSDTTPPVMSLLADVSADATSPTGAVVTYKTPSAVDDVDGAVPVACAPASGASFQVGTSIVVCTARDAAGNSSAASFKVIVRVAAPQVNVVSLATNDLVFDRGARLLYASVPSRAGALGNRVVAIDPATGSVVASVFVGSEPAKLALSPDGQFLYVALNGAGAVRRVDLPTLTAGLQFSLGSDSFFGPYQVEDMAVLPDDPHAVAVSRMYTGTSPRHAGVAIYDDGVKRQDSTPGHTGSNVIEFGSLPGRLYGYNNETTEFGFRRMTVGQSGVSVLDVTTDLISRFGVDMEFDAGKLFTTNGRVLDPEALVPLGTFPVVSSGPVEPDVLHGKAFVLSAADLQEFDPATYTPRQSFPISGVSGSASSLVNIGRSDLAFRTTGDQVFLAHFAAGPDTTAPTITTPADLTVNATSRSGAAVTYTAFAIDDVDGAVRVLCAPASGATFPLGATTVTCSASDAAGNGRTATFKVTVRPDTTPPVVSVPSDFGVDATGPSGAVVGYTASAVDDFDGSIPVTCAPASGAAFAIGTTTVTCTATDSFGNSSTASFKVTVRGALGQIAALDKEVVLLPDPKLGNSLDSKLHDAADALQRAQPNRACSKLTDFIGLVQAHAGEKIPQATATAWIAEATRIKAVIGC